VHGSGYGPKHLNALAGSPPSVEADIAQTTGNVRF